MQGIVDVEEVFHLILSTLTVIERDRNDGEQRPPLNSNAALDGEKGEKRREGKQLLPLLLEEKQRDGV